MRYIMLLVFCVLSFLGKAQINPNVEIVCYPCISETVVSCDGCGISSELFEGIVIKDRRNGDIAFRKPIRIQTEGRSVTFSDLYGNVRGYSLRQLGYKNIPEFYADMKTCACTGGGGDGGITIEDVLDGFDTDLTITQLSDVAYNFTYTDEDGDVYSETVNIPETSITQNPDGSYTYAGTLNNYMFDYRIDAEDDTTYNLVSNGVILSSFVVPQRSVITSGDGITITGTGTPLDPYVITEEQILTIVTGSTSAVARQNAALVGVVAGEKFKWQDAAGNKFEIEY